MKNGNGKLYRKLAKCFGGVAAGELLLGLIISIVMNTAVNAETARLILLVLGGNAFVFFIMAAVMLILDRREAAKAERLRTYGRRYEALVSRVYENRAINIGRRSPIILECVYRDDNDRSCLVKSGSIWPDMPVTDIKGIEAAVWVNPDNPKDYYVEARIGGGEQQSQYDYDYR